MNTTLREPIENVYPEAYRLARKFHERYEEYAPQFGYNTREETKEFNPDSPNGRTMAKVCYEIVQEEIKERNQALITTIEKANEKQPQSEYEQGFSDGLESVVSLMTDAGEE